MHRHYNLRIIKRSCNETTPVITVLGEVSAQELGVTLTHEHLLIDLTCLFSTPQSTERDFLVGECVTPALRDTLVSDPYHCWDNLLLQDVNAQALDQTRVSIRDRID
ncbi:MAG: hypothetical protein K2X93_05165 [Candidatus Obscuribacterales bacterium]|nr:hypothetical protein [Candidatus Obscuribacterales bacterium]